MCCLKFLASSKARQNTEDSSICVDKVRSLLRHITQTTSSLPSSNYYSTFNSLSNYSNRSSISYFLVRQLTQLCSVSSLEVFKFSPDHLGYHCCSALKNRLPTSPGYWITTYWLQHYYIPTRTALAVVRPMLCRRTPCVTAFTLTRLPYSESTPLAPTPSMASWSEERVLILK